MAPDACRSTAYVFMVHTSDVQGGWHVHDTVCTALRAELSHTAGPFSHHNELLEDIQ
jgi:hypothetical protein